MLDRRIVRAAVVIGAFGAVFLLGRWGLHAAHARHERVARAAVHKCLFGRPLDPGERPAGRLHRISLYDPPSDWPSRCDRYLDDLIETRDDLDLDAPGAYRPDHVDVNDITGRPWDFDVFFETTAPRPDVEAPAEVVAAPGSAPIGDDKTLGAPGDLIGATFDPMPGHGLRFLMQGHRLCEAAPALDTWSCADAKPGTAFREHACSVSSGEAIWSAGEGSGTVTFGTKPAMRFELPKTEGFLTAQGRVASCDPDAITITEVISKHRRRTEFDGHGFIVHAVRCTAEAGCAAPETIDVDDMLRNESDASRPDGIRDDVRAVGHDGKLLVLWRSANHGVRFRIGTAKDIGAAPDFVAYDDRMSDGDPFAMSTIQESFQVIGRWDASVLALESIGARGGVKLFRIAPNGPITTIAVK